MASIAPDAINNHAAFIWSVADLLGGNYKQADYGKVTLPLVVLRRLDSVLEPRKDEVLTTLDKLQGKVARRRPLRFPFLHATSPHRRVHGWCAM